ncbi:hypothetical protein UFOVP190_188 [uncultured Caudovirales phage]|uniref:Uncharacterized protein n=1 Tax=uncultured Caudovirales phage TaxID=2100421 RepID=A0A6J7WJY3_9CAUD|nr:hypothetical protein UFOVP190_188 [uncultured Caudovirales phage]
MTLFRHTNGLLYTLAQVSPRGYTGSWLEAVPYRHSVATKTPKRADFTAVAVYNRVEE